MKKRYDVITVGHILGFSSKTITKYARLMGMSKTVVKKKSSSHLMYNLTLAEIKAIRFKLTGTQPRPTALADWLEIDEHTIQLNAVGTGDELKESIAEFVDREGSLLLVRNVTIEKIVNAKRKRISEKLLDC